jgi:hypothetical protein
MFGLAAGACATADKLAAAKAILEASALHISRLIFMVQVLRTNLLDSFFRVRCATSMYRTAQLRSCGHLQNFIVQPLDSRYAISAKRVIYQIYVRRGNRRCVRFGKNWASAELTNGRGDLRSVP